MNNSKKFPKFQVDICTPGERHVNGMQVNGYENPTYSFFDNKAWILGFNFALKIEILRDFLTFGKSLWYLVR